MSAGTKTCRTCEQEKPLEEFGRDKSSQDFRSTQCRDCIYERTVRKALENQGVAGFSQRDFTTGIKGVRKVEYTQEESP